MIDARTIIGTATLPDWIMGGKLTSRLWVQELDNGNILFPHPLRNDDIETSDRRYLLMKGRDDDKIQVVQNQQNKLRRLASLVHPFVKDENEQSGWRATPHQSETSKCVWILNR